ncbi:MAG: translation initiation factor IF-2 [Flavobacteriales bacterium]|nr:translation initiation factor IF-2 [Flavobacteriales bacterium]
MRLSKAAKELNITIQRIGEFLVTNGHDIIVSPNTKISEELYSLLLKEFKSDINQKQQSVDFLESKRQKKEALVENQNTDLSNNTFNIDETDLKDSNPISKDEDKDKTEIVKQNIGETLTSELKNENKKDDNHQIHIKEDLEITDEISLSNKSDELEKEKNIQNLGQQKVDNGTSDVSEKSIKKDESFIKSPAIKLKKLGTINLPEKKSKQKVASSTHVATKKKRKRITGEVKKLKKPDKSLPNDQDVKDKIAQTLEQLTSKGKSKSAKIRREKRQERKEKAKEDQLKQQEASAVIKVTEFVTVSEFANMMNVSVNEVISSCMQLGIMVTMNQRLDAETISIVADEFKFQVEFVSSELEEFITEEESELDELQSPRSPIVTIMGHVDHGKTSLLDYIRKTNVIAGEAGGITQHIAAYEVLLSDHKSITFIDTPGHEAFTAMRARGAQVTDVVIIVIAVDDDVMPQTKEAISHAQAADVPIIFAFNKMDKDGANPDKIKEQLSQMNMLVEDWGGKFQSQEVSAKTGLGIKELLEKVLLESELLDLKANPSKNAKGTVLEASLDKGKGYVTTVLVQEGTLKIGDFMLAGRFTGKVKALFNERDQKVNNIKPASPVTLLGLNGAPQAGDVFYIRKDEKEAKTIAAKRDQLQREQSVRTHKHITLDEIGRRLAIGDFKELNIILKGDVDGSIEALSDSLLKLSTDTIQINVIHKAVGQITESDVLLASASDAIIIGFQVRPSMAARKLAEKESIDIRLYSIIYDTINSIKDAIEGMHEPQMIEKILGNIEIRNVFKLTKAGIVAGCYVLDGSVIRNSKVRLIRNGIVVYTGVLDTLKRFKEDVKEVQKGYECGLTIKNFNDIKVGDLVEVFEETAN